MSVRLYIPVGGHVWDFEHHSHTHCLTVSIPAGRTKENASRLAFMDALAHSGCSRSSLGTLRLRVFFQLAPITVDGGEAALKGKSAEHQHSNLGPWIPRPEGQQEFTR